MIGDGESEAAHERGQRQRTDEGVGMETTSEQGAPVWYTARLTYVVHDDAAQVRWRSA